jgi:hypothetical protein
MTYKEIAKLIPTIQATHLVSENLKSSKFPKKDGSGKGIRANRGRAGCEKTEIVGLGMKNIVGVNLIKINADLIGTL